MDLIRDIFWEEDVHDILQIPLPVIAVNDRQVWHFTKSRIYSVRSGYYLARETKIQRMAQLKG